MLTLNNLDSFFAGTGLEQREQRLKDRSQDFPEACVIISN